MLRYLHLAALACSFGVLVAPSSAQMPTVELAAGDVDGDGYDDLAVAYRFAGGWKSGGELHVVDGRSGVLRWKRAGFGAGHGVLLGTTILDEGVNSTLVVAAVHDLATHELRIELLRGASGLLLTTYTLPATRSEFSCRLAPLDDVDGDGTVELAVARPWYSSNAEFEGRVALLSLVTGCEVSALDGGSERRFLGQALAVGCFDRTSGVDLAVAAWFGGRSRDSDSCRSVLTLTGRTLEPIFERLPDSCSVAFEPTLVTCGDTDGDGLDELLFGSLRVVDPETADFVAEGRVVPGQPGSTRKLFAVDHAYDDAVLITSLRGVGVGSGFVVVGTPREFAWGAGAWRVFDATGSVLRTCGDAKRAYYPIALVAADVHRDPPSRLIVAGAREAEEVDHYLVDLECWGGPSWTTCLWSYELEPRAR